MSTVLQHQESSGFVTSCFYPHPPSRVLEFVRSPERLIHLSPLVSSVTLVGENTYETVDRLFLLGCIPYTWKYTTRFKLNEAGVISESDAGAVKTSSSWVVEEAEGGCRLIEEFGIVKARWGTQALSIYLAKGARIPMFEKLAEALM
jgi:hypothetical protein